MNHKALLIAAATVLALTGCASTPTVFYSYTGPAAAQLTIQNRAANGVTLTAHDDGARCTGGLGIDSGIPNPKGPSRLPEGKSVTLAVPSGKEWAVHLASDDVGDLAMTDTNRRTWKQCTVVGSFVPVAGKQYRALYDMKDGVCYFAVYAIERAPDGKATESREASERLRSQVLGGAGGSRCQ